MKWQSRLTQATVLVVPRRESVPKSSCQDKGWAGPCFRSSLEPCGAHPTAVGTEARPSGSSSGRIKRGAGAYLLRAALAAIYRSLWMWLLCLESAGFHLKKGNQGTATGGFYLCFTWPHFLNSCNVSNAFAFPQTCCCPTADSPHVAEAEEKSPGEPILEEWENQKLKRNECWAMGLWKAPSSHPGITQ